MSTKKYISELGKIMADKVIINPTFRNGVDGKLFRNKDTNRDIQETIVLNNLFTRLSIPKGELAYFPTLGLKQHLGKLVFNDTSDTAMAIEEFEEDMREQMGQNCSIDYELDVDNRLIKMKISLEKLKYAVQMEYSGINGSIRIIEPQFD